MFGRLLTTDATVAVIVKQDKKTQKKLWVLILSGCVEKRLPPTKKERPQRTEDRKHTWILLCVLFLCPDLVHGYMMIYFLWLSRRICALLFFSPEGTGRQRTSRTPRPRSLLRNPMSTTSTTFGTQCLNFYVTRTSAYPWKRFLTRKIWGGSHFLVISHWTSYSTKNELASEKKTHPLLTPRTNQARLGTLKCASEDSITFDNYDPQSSEFARQVKTGAFLIRIDRSVHDGYVRNSLLNDPLIDYDDESVDFLVEAAHSQIRGIAR